MLQHECFPVKFAKFLRTPFFKEHLQWLLLHLSGQPMLGELNWYVETPPQVFSCKFYKILITAAFCHKMWIIKIYQSYDSYMQWAHSLMVSKYSLPITEVYLEPSWKSTMKIFCKNN